MYLFQRIEEVAIKHNDARRAVGEFVLREKDNIMNYTIQEIAEQTYTSKATVVRFAKTLGYSGWREFIKDFVAEVHYEDSHSKDVDVNYPFNAGDTTSEVIEKLRTLQMEAIQDTTDIMDVAVMEEAANRLFKAKRVALLGMSPNIYIGELFRRKMVTVNKPVEVVNPTEDGIVSRTLGPEDCAIVISYSGNTENVAPTSHIKTLKDRGVKLIGITSGGTNYIRDNIDCVLTISSKERLYTKIANFATEESIQFILNVLFSVYFKKEYQKNIQFKIEGSRFLEIRRHTSLNEMKDNI